MIDPILELARVANAQAAYETNGDAQALTSACEAATKAAELAIREAASLEELPKADPLTWFTDRRTEFVTMNELHGDDYANASLQQLESLLAAVALNGDHTAKVFALASAQRRLAGLQGNALGYAETQWVKQINTQIHNLRIEIMPADVLTAPARAKAHREAARSLAIAAGKAKYAIATASPDKSMAGRGL